MFQTQVTDPREDFIPYTTAMVGAIQHSTQRKDPLLVLLDSGASGSWINKASLPHNVVPTIVDTVTGKTMAGEFTSNRQVRLQQFVLPEFSKHRVMPELVARVFEQPCRYDLILGRDALDRFGFILDFASRVVTWDDMTIAMRPFRSVDPSDTPLAEQLFQEAIDPFLDAECPCGVCDAHTTETEQQQAAELGYKSKTILSSTYDAVDIDKLVDSCEHLNRSQRRELAKLLKKFDKLFDGQLKEYKGEQIHLDVDPAVPPHRSKAYTVPRSHWLVFKRELDRLVRIGVLEPVGRSNWMAGTFIIPKKDGKVRWITDFRGLNKALRRKVYPLPRIKDILQRRPGFRFLTKLDISMQYYTFVLDESSRDLCTIITPFGLYRYRRLPMGVSQSPDIAQEVMEKLLEDLEVYIDDIACFSDSWEAHLILLDKVLTRLQAAGFTINPRKCEWGVQETDFLGHWLTPTGIKPWKKKIDSILKMEPPKDLKQLRSFIGLVNYYRDMWPRRAHVLAPLTELTGKQFVWTEAHTASFNQMKALMSGDALLAYPDHNLPFHIETDASDYQLGAVIKQNDRPVAFYTRKLTSAQRNYSTIEKELLSVVETLREFRNILLGAELHIYTDHKNLTHKLSSYATQRVLRWRLLIEEYSPKLHYKEGPVNFIADALSRVPTSRTERESPEHVYDPFSVSHPAATKPVDPNDDEAFTNEADAQKNNEADAQNKNETNTMADGQMQDCKTQDCVKPDAIRFFFHPCFSTSRKWLNVSWSTHVLMRKADIHFILQPFNITNRKTNKYDNYQQRIQMTTLYNNWEKWSWSANVSDVFATKDNVTFKSC